MSFDDPDHVQPNHVRNRDPEPMRWMRVTVAIAFEPRLLEQVCGDHPVDDLQYRGVQFGMHGEETEQRAPGAMVEVQVMEGVV
ncbi:MAG: hypothetical protein EXR27_22370 [Betaproteobacteria bacterium]|nr:hypothetical protein [Betaproteobacteria bacterium]